MNEELEQPFGGRQLFTVSVETEIPVIAASEEEATEIAKEQASAGGDIDWNDAEYDVSEADYVPVQWNHVIPSGFSHRERQQTCEQILKAWEEYRAAQPPTKAELEAAGQQRLV